MPKLNNRLPKYSRINNQAVVYYRGKPHYLGRYGSPESKIAYSRFISEIQANPIFLPAKAEKHVSICELTAAFLDHAKKSMDSTEYGHYRIIILDFLDKLYGDGISVDDFKPRCLKLVREEMIQSGRFCRRIVNRYTFWITAIFAWGVENDLVPETVWRALKSVKSVPKGYPGTFDNEEREPVSDDVIRRTLPFMSPTLRAMVIVQRLTGMRPSEVFNMRVGEIIKNVDSELWHYVKKDHKTERFIGKKAIPLGRPEQELIAPYLAGKTPEQAVFSPRTAMQEHGVERRANRKTKISPSQAAQEKARATKPSPYSEFYSKYSYRQAIIHAIEKGNRQLPEEDQIPHWFPYQLRHSAATATELAHSDEDAQALLGHTSVNMTKRYAHNQLTRREELARKRHNPFENEG